MCPLCKVETESLKVYEIVEAENEEHAKYRVELQYSPIKSHIEIEDCPEDLYLRYVAQVPELFESLDEGRPIAARPMVRAMPKPARDGRSRNDHYAGARSGK